MKGSEIKEKLVKDGYKLSDVAQGMGITPQSLHKLLLTEDVKTGVVERIATAVNKDVLYFFDVQKDKYEEITLINEITHKRKLIYFLYQKIVDISVLNTDYFNITATYEDKLAAEIMNNCMYPVKDGQTKESVFIRISDIEDWKAYSLDKKRWFNSELGESVRLLQDIFFEKFDLLYKKIRNLD